MFWISIAAFGALGAVLRTAFSHFLPVTSVGAFPWALFLVNVLGSFLAGALAQSSFVTPAVKMALMMGFLGALTTFSAYSLELIKMMEQGKWASFAVFMLAQNLFALAACWAGWKSSYFLL